MNISKYDGGSRLSSLGMDR